MRYNSDKNVNQQARDAIAKEEVRSEFIANNAQTKNYIPDEATFAKFIKSDLKLEQPTSRAMQHRHWEVICTMEHLGYGKDIKQESGVAKFTIDDPVLGQIRHDFAQLLDEHKINIDLSDSREKLKALAEETTDHSNGQGPKLS